MSSSSQPSAAISAPAPIHRFAVDRAISSSMTPAWRHATTARLPRQLEPHGVQQVRLPSPLFPPTRADCLLPGAPGPQGGTRAPGSTGHAKARGGMPRTVRRRRPVSDLASLLRSLRARVAEHALPRLRSNSGHFPRALSAPRPPRTRDRFVTPRARRVAAAPPAVRPIPSPSHRSTVLHGARHARRFRP